MFPMHADVMVKNLRKLRAMKVVSTRIIPVEDLQNGRRQVFFGERTELEQATCNQEVPITIPGTIR